METRWCLRDVQSYSSLEHHGRADPKEDRAKYMALPFTDCSAMESRPCDLPGQDSSASPGCEVAGEPGPEVLEESSAPFPLPQASS